MLSRDSFLDAAKVAADTGASVLIGTTGPAKSYDPEWNSIPALESRLIQTAGHAKAERIAERIEALRNSNADWIAR